MFHSRKTSKNNKTLEANPSRRYLSPQSRIQSRKMHVSNMRGRDRLPKLIIRDSKTNHGYRDISGDDRLNQTTNHFLNPREIRRSKQYRSASRQRMGVKKKQIKRPIWKPVGNVQKRDGYSIITKLYY